MLASFASATGIVMSPETSGSENSAIAADYELVKKLCRRIPDSSPPLFWFYPARPFEEELQDRFVQLENNLKSALEASDMRDKMRAYRFRPCHCGPTYESAIPAMVITCPRDLHIGTKKILQQPYVQRLYIRPDTANSIKLSIRTRLFGEAPSNYSPTLVPVFYDFSDEPTRRFSSLKYVKLDRRYPWVAGTLISFRGRTATIGLTLQIHRNLYGVTVDHLFHKWCTFPGPLDAHPLSREREARRDTAPQDPGEQMEGVFVHCEESYDISEPYLDWALVEVSRRKVNFPREGIDGIDPSLEFLNCITEKTPPRGLRVIHRVAKGLPDKLLPVMIITGSAGMKHGMLLPSYTSIGGDAYRALTKVMNVILDDGQAVQAGDCGSLVLGTDSLEAYGHVMSVGPYNEIDVVPLTSTIAQVKLKFPEQHVALPQPLETAIIDRNTELLLRLISEGYDINEKGGLYGCAIQAAASEGSKEILDILLEKGADVNTNGGLYGTAIQAASLLMFPHIVETLVQHGADVNATGGLFGNPLIAACSNDWGAPAARILINAGANPNSCDANGNAALQISAKKGLKGIVELLVEKGAIINNLPDSLGSAALLAALDSKKRNDSQLISLYLIKHGAYPNTRSNMRETALWKAIENRWDDVAEALLEAGADPNLTVGGLQKVLERSIINSLPVRLVRALLDKGPDDLASKHSTLLLTATATNPADRNQIVRMLLERGFDPNATNAEGETALDIAKREKFDDLVHLLQTDEDWAYVHFRSDSLYYSFEPTADLSESSGTQSVATQSAAHAGSFWDSLTTSQKLESVGEPRRDLYVLDAWNPVGDVRKKWNTEIWPAVLAILRENSKFFNLSYDDALRCQPLMISSTGEWRKARPTIVLTVPSKAIAGRISSPLLSHSLIKESGFDILGVRARARPLYP